MAKGWDIKGGAADKNLETCARQIIVTQFLEMMSYKAGAREGTDIEFVHDMRVTSRRLRVTLQNFAHCFPNSLKEGFKKRYKKIKAITRTMGAVRDLDVLIVRFEKELATLSEAEQGDIRGVIEHLQRKRAEARKPMLALFEKLETTGFETKFLTFFQNSNREIQPPRKPSTPVGEISSSRCLNAGIILSQRVEDVYAWEPFIWDAARREELHNMRISIKRLRYTMEFFEHTYDERFTECLSIIVDLQEILGDIHDCDVVLEILTAYQQTRSEKDKCEMAEAREHSPRVSSGIATLIARSRETRKADYETFLKKWEQLSATGFKQKLLAISLSE